MLQLIETTWDKIEDVAEIKYVRIKTKEEFKKDGLPVEERYDGIFTIDITPFFIGRMNILCGLVCEVIDVMPDVYPTSYVFSSDLRGDARFHLQFCKELNPPISETVADKVKLFYFREYMLVPLVKENPRMKIQTNGSRNFEEGLV